MAPRAQNVYTTGCFARSVYGRSNTRYTHARTYALYIRIDIFIFGFVPRLLSLLHDSRPRKIPRDDSKRGRDAYPSNALRAVEIQFSRRVFPSQTTARPTVDRTNGDRIRRCDIDATFYHTFYIDEIDRVQAAVGGVLSPYTPTGGRVLLLRERLITRTIPKIWPPVKVDERT